MNYPAIDVDANSIFDIPNLTGTPERRLLLAILERALLDYVGNDSQEVEEAEGWIFDSEEAPDTCAPFTFVWICKELDLDVGDIRDKVREMPKRGASRIAPWYLTKDYERTKKARSERAQKETFRSSRTSPEKRGDLISLFDSSRGVRKVH